MNLKQLTGKIKDGQNFVYTAKNGDTFVFTKNAKGKFIGQRNVPDCEHNGDIERECYELRDLGATIEETYWDGEDCGEAYVLFSADTVKGFMDIICNIYEGVDINLERVAKYLISGDTKENHITVENGRLKWEWSEQEKQKQLERERKKKYGRFSENEYNQFSEFIEDLRGINNIEFRINGKSEESLGSFCQYDNQIEVYPKLGYYKIYFYASDDGLTFYSETTKGDCEFGKEKFIEWLKRLDNEGIMTDSLANELMFPCYGEEGFNFVFSKPNVWEPDGGIIYRIKEGVIQILDFTYDEIIARVPVDEFDEYFEKTTGISPDLIKR